ncbi:MAG TPA: hypothetical protein VNV66_18350 [Pilimelia sp.]|nr:hypothetical protein [Pilimelia sp.]
MDERQVVKALQTWCAPEFADKVMQSGIAEISASIASVDSVRTIYLRRYHNAPPNSVARAQALAVLDALKRVDGADFGMAAFESNGGAKGIVMATLDGEPLYAFGIRQPDCGET